MKLLLAFLFSTLILISNSQRFKVVKRFRSRGTAKEQIIFHDASISPSTVRPARPTTSAPQKYLRSLCQKPRGMFPHPLDCRKYLDCWDGRVLEVYCPNDLMFSDLGSFCDYWEYVDCGNRPISDQTNQTTTMRPIKTTTTTTMRPPRKGKWVAASRGSVPAGAIESGFDKDILFIGRSLYQGHLIPCSIEKGQGCRLAWDNTEYIMENYEALIDADIHWIHTSTIGEKLPNNVVPAGYIKLENNDNLILYVGRGYIDGKLIPGYFTNDGPPLVHVLDDHTYFPRNFELAVYSTHTSYK